MKTKWTKEFPKVEGWYWCKYTGKHGLVICPANITRIQDVGLAQSAGNDTFYSDNRFRDNDDLKFGPKIEEPT